MGAFSLFLGLAGTLLIASPIIIHLLSRRKYVTVNWAAMDFLLQAEKRNRKRLQLEQLLLLLLRILAILLIAWAIARPYFTDSSLAAQVVAGQSFHRIFVLDDSPSMGEVEGNQTPFDQGKANISAMIRYVAEQRTSDSLTVYLTSQPEKAVIAGQTITPGNQQELLDEVESLRISDRGAQFETALSMVNKMLANEEDQQNVELYMLSDTRERDWKDAAQKSILKALSTKLAAVNYVDVGVAGEVTLPNLGIVNITPGEKEKVIVRGVVSEFQVEVKNHGTADVKDVRVALSLGENYTQTQTLDVVRAGETSLARFQVLIPEKGSAKLEAQLLTPDVLAADNVRYYAASITEGVQLLLVDGDRNYIDDAASETFYLYFAIDPNADNVASGNKITLIDDNDLPSTELDAYQVIFLCNVSRIDDQTAERLAKWVENGGGLVYFLGDDIVQDSYSKLLANKIFPAKLDQIGGDPRRKQFGNISIDKSAHPIFRIFTEAGPAVLEEVKLFRWWELELDKKAVENGDVEILARVDQQPVVLQQRLGTGNVIVYNITADVAWTNWPVHYSFVSLVQSTISAVTHSALNDYQQLVGSKIQHPINPAKFENKVRIVPPNEDMVTTRQAALLEEEVDGEERLMMQINIEGEDAMDAGIYELQMQSHTLGEQSVHYALNTDAREGELTVMTESALKTELAEVENLNIIRGEISTDSGIRQAKSEFWLYLVLAAVLVLGVEQFLAWHIGRTW